VKVFLYYFLFQLIIQSLELFFLPSYNASLPNLTKRNFSGYSGYSCECHVLSFCPQQAGIPQIPLFPHGSQLSTCRYWCWTRNQKREPCWVIEVPFVPLRRYNSAEEKVFIKIQRYSLSFWLIHTQGD